jgi:hypothetical protein
MTTTTNNFTRVSVINKEYITATEKQRILMVVNENKPEFLGRVLKAGKIKLMVELVEETIYNVTFYYFHKYGMLGSYESKSTTQVKLS